MPVREITKRRQDDFQTLAIALNAFGTMIDAEMGLVLNNPNSKAESFTELLKEVAKANDKAGIELQLILLDPDKMRSALEGFQIGLVIKKAMAIPNSILGGIPNGPTVIFTVGDLRKTNLKKSALNIQSITKETLPELCAAYDEIKVFAELTKDLCNRER